MKTKPFLINAITLISLFVLSGNAGAIANPASVACAERGYVSEVRIDSKTGGQYGVCKSSNGEECTEWAFFRGECALDGQTYSPTYDQGRVFRYSILSISAVLIFLLISAVLVFFVVRRLYFWLKK